MWGNPSIRIPKIIQVINPITLIDNCKPMPKLKDMRKKNKSRLKPREISEENLSLKNSQIDRLTMIDIAMDRKFKGRNRNYT